MDDIKRGQVVVVLVVLGCAGDREVESERGGGGWEEAGGCVGRAGCEAAPHNAQRRAQNVGIYERGRSRGKRGRECAHAESRDRGSNAGR